MRVISGSARGLKLKAPEGMNTRPTTDRIKESLFNIIASELYDISFLDLFSGSGGIGIEALSRGAESAVFVDSSRESIDIIKDNIKRAKFDERSTVLKSDALSALNQLGNKGSKFDIIFMDPPYSKGFVEPVLEAVVRYELLKAKGFIIVEQAIDEPEIRASKLQIFRVKEYKTTKMIFLEYAEDM